LGVIQADPRVGFQGIWRTITFTDAMNNVLEQVHRANRVSASTLPLTMSFGDYQGLQMRYGVFGARQNGIDLRMNMDMPFCCKLTAGLSDSVPIPFNMIGKLKLQLELTNSSMLLFGTNAAAGVGASFQVRDVKLVYNVVNMGSPVPLPQGGIQYKHFSSFNATLQSSDYQNQYQMNLSNCLGAVNTFVKSEYLNNYSHNSLRTYKIFNGTSEVDIVNSSVLKNNVKFPRDFETDERLINDRNNGRNGYDTWRSLQYISSLKPYHNLTHCLISPYTEGFPGSSGYNQPDPTPVYGLGVKYNVGNVRMGTSFAGGNMLTNRIVSKNVSSTPNEIFTYALATKTLRPTPNGSVIVN
jgi:hypothetical protein